MSGEATFPFRPRDHQPRPRLTRRPSDKGGGGMTALPGIVGRSLEEMSHGSAGKLTHRNGLGAHPARRLDRKDIM